MCNTDIGHVSYWGTMWSGVARMKAIEARLEGMKIYNHSRLSQGKTEAYDEVAFEQIAQEFDAIAEWLATNC